MRANQRAEMTREHARTLLRLRGQLGGLLRAALEPYNSLGHNTELGRELHEGEFDEIGNDLDALRRAILLLGAAVGAFRQRHGKEIGDYASTRVGYAVRDVDHAEVLLADAQREAVAAADAAKPEIVLGHQRSLLERMRQGLSFVRAAWDSLYYAVQAEPKEILTTKLDAQHARRFHWVTDVRQRIMDDALATAARREAVVEVRSPDGELLFQADPFQRVGIAELRMPVTRPAPADVRRLTKAESIAVEQWRREHGRAPRVAELRKILGPPQLEVPAELTANPADDVERAEIWSIDLRPLR